MTIRIYIAESFQEKVYEELRETFENSNRPMTTDEINKLTFLDQCIKETLRLFAAVPVVIRHTYEDLPISSTYIILWSTRIVLEKVKATF